MGNKQEREMKKFTSQKSSKFILANMVDGVSSTIFANNGIYIAITFFVRLSMLIQRVMIFHKFSFFFISSIMQASKIQCAFLGCERGMNTRTTINLFKIS
jgi:hypothetical protein